MMITSDARRRANEKWHKKQDEIKLRVPKGEKETIRQYAATRGESLNGFIIRTVREAMARDAERIDPE